MPTQYIRRGTAIAPGQTGRRAASPIFVDADTDTLKIVPAASGTSEKEIADLSSSQTFTGTKTFNGDGVGGVVVAKTMNFVEDATSVTHTGTVVLPAGAVLLEILVSGGVLWTAAAAVMKIGDSVDDDGYYTAVDLKATDLLVGESISIQGSNVAASAGQQGAYLVAATGQRGPLSTNFGAHNVAGTSITAVITVTTPATTAGRTYVTVFYAIGQTVTIVKA
jgi:hypothetical protein